MDADAYHCRTCKHGVVGDCSRCEDEYELSRNSKTPTLPTERNAHMKLTFNHTNVLRLMEATFSSSNTFITELMQNARRAGAEEILITCEDIPTGGVNMTFMDDGIGIDDFSKLMTIAESGWNEQIQKVDKPFGAGFLAAILSCERGEVWSNGSKLSWVTEELMQGESAVIETNVIPPVDFNTVISLVGVATKKPAQLSVHKVGEFISLHAYGFPIAVRLNGSLVERGHEANEMINIQIPDIGTLCFLRGLRNPASMELALYLQGLPIEFDGSTAYSRKRFSQLILHLDSEKFEARMPDRAALRDDSVKNIERKIKPFLPMLAAEVDRFHGGEYRCLGDFAFVATHAPNLTAQAKAIPANLYYAFDNPDRWDCVRATWSDQDDWYSHYDDEQAGMLSEDSFKKLVVLTELPSNKEDNQGVAANALTAIAVENGITFLMPDKCNANVWSAMPAWVPKPWEVDFETTGNIRFISNREPRAATFQRISVKAYHCPNGYAVELRANNGEVIADGTVENGYDLCIGTADGKVLFVNDISAPGVELFRQDQDNVEGGDEDYRWDEIWEDQQIHILKIELANTFDDDEETRQAKVKSLVEEAIAKALDPYRAVMPSQGEMTVELQFVAGEKVAVSLKM